MTDQPPDKTSRSSFGLCANNFQTGGFKMFAVNFCNDLMIHKQDHIKSGLFTAQHPNKTDYLS